MLSLSNKVFVFVVFYYFLTFDNNALLKCGGICEPPYETICNFLLEKQIIDFFFLISTTLTPRR